MGKCCCKSRCNCCVGFLAFCAGLLILSAIIIFGIVPVIFKYSVEIQRNLIFPTWLVEEQNYSDIIEQYGLQGVRNFYVNVNEEDNITLGVWQILPQDLIRESLSNDQYDYERFLSDKEYDILIYLHGNGNSRAGALELYDILRKYFQVVACDYRGYADSSKADLTETGIVDDVTNLYKWLRNRTEARIFFWGHSLGTGVSTHTVSRLKAQNMTPSGLVLETPFSSVIDVVDRHPAVQAHKWLPWYRQCFLDPIVSNGFGFDSMKYIVDVDCPIMILHAKDDSVIPYELATKLYEVAIEHRNYTTQGNVTYHLFPPKGYDHMFIFLEPELPNLIKDFREQCLEFENKTRNNNNLPKL